MWALIRDSSHWVLLSPILNTHIWSQKVFGYLKEKYSFLLQNISGLSHCKKSLYLTWFVIRNIIYLCIGDIAVSALLTVHICIIIKSPTVFQNLAWWWSFYISATSPSYKKIVFIPKLKVIRSITLKTMHIIM